MENCDGRNNNRRYVFEKRYCLDNDDEMFQFDQDIMKLTKRSARVSVIVGSTVLSMHVYCRTNTSKVYRTCEKLGFVPW